MNSYFVYKKIISLQVSVCPRVWQSPLLDILSGTPWEGIAFNATKPRSAPPPHPWGVAPVRLLPLGSQHFQLLFLVARLSYYTGLTRFPDLWLHPQHLLLRTLSWWLPGTLVTLSYLTLSRTLPGSPLFPSLHGQWQPGKYHPCQGHPAGSCRARLEPRPSENYVLSRPAHCLWGGWPTWAPSLAIPSSPSTDYTTPCAPLCSGPGRMLRSPCVGFNSGDGDANDTQTDQASKPAQVPGATSLKTCPQGFLLL